MAEVKIVLLDQIRENPVALRSVDRQSEAYLGLVGSIGEKGVLNAISLRKKVDAESGKDYYELIDGLHRYCAAQDAGLKEIPAQIIALDDAGVLEAQFIANIHKVETKPIQYTKQLMRILASNPLMTEAELAQKIAKSPAYIVNRLGLVKLHDKIQPLVDEGKINLSNAFALAKLPKDEQLNFVDRAQTDPPQKFIQEANARVKEIRDAKRQGRDPNAAKFEPMARLQKVKDVQTELGSHAVQAALIKDLGIKTVQEAFDMGLKWCIHMDPKSVEAAKIKYEQREKDVKEQKEKRKLDRANKKAKEAAENAAKLQEEAKKAPAPAAK